MIERPPQSGRLFVGDQGMTISSALAGVVFDAYGTLFDVYGVQAELEARFPGKGRAIAEKWREKQIEYSRLRTMSSRYVDFWQITGDALDYACEFSEAPLDTGARASLLAVYERLPPHPEVPAALRALVARGLALAVLSNGNEAMLNAALDAAGLRPLFAHVLSVERVQQIQDGAGSLPTRPRRVRAAGERTAVRLLQRLGRRRRRLVRLSRLLDQPRERAGGAARGSDLCRGPNDEGSRRLARRRLNFADERAAGPGGAPSPKLICSRRTARSSEAGWRCRRSRRTQSTRRNRRPSRSAKCPLRWPEPGTMAARQGPRTSWDRSVPLGRCPHSA